MSEQPVYALLFPIVLYTLMAKQMTWFLEHGVWEYNGYWHKQEIRRRLYKQLLENYSEPTQLTFTHF
jgi:hypothetical protein